MPTSGSADFTINRDGIIRVALQKIGAIVEGENGSTQEVTDAAIELNLLVKAWQADGLPLWAVKKGTLFLQKDQNLYMLGNTSSADHATNSYVKVTLTANAAAAATTLTVDSVAGISNGDKIGVILNSGSIFWTTVSGAPSGSTITLAAGLTGAASSGKRVYTYTNKIVRPLKIVEIWRHDDNDRDVPINIIARQQYAEQVLKTTDGFVVEAFYEPTINGSPSTPVGQLEIWPEQQDLTTSLQFYYHAPFEDFDSSTDEPGFPQEWFLALCYGLADLLADTYHVSPAKAQQIQSKAMMFKKQAQDSSQEYASIRLQPDYIYQEEK